MSVDGLVWYTLLHHDSNDFIVSGMVLQGFLAILALSTLFLKRHREHPKRPLIIWFFDASKQALGSGFIHFCNVILSALTAASTPNEKSSNPCVWYFLNVLVDTTLGVFILLFFLKLLDRVIHGLGIKEMSSGYYGRPPQVRVWIKQTTAFIVGLFLTKIVVLIVLQLHLFVVFGEWVLSPLTNPHTQLLVVMLFFPLVMNIVQFWLIDSFIRSNRSYELTADEDYVYEEFDSDPVRVPDPASIALHSSSESLPIEDDDQMRN